MLIPLFTLRLTIACAAMGCATRLHDPARMMVQPSLRAFNVSVSLFIEPSPQYLESGATFDRRGNAAPVLAIILVLKAMCQES